ncbi:type II restriction endonuclease subunit M [Pseudoramibacter alactolyticus]|nr:type II restriction endonuclease subunit M [Pseudoramibacter alactolyticus]
MKTTMYWRIRKKILDLIFKIKKVGFIVNNRRQSSKEYRSFTKLLFGRFISGATKGIILAFILGIIDWMLLEYGVIKVIDSNNSNILADIIIGELGVAGVILGLYCSNISSVYSTRYANAPEKIAIAFQYDRLTAKCLNAISSFIIYGTIILVKLLMGYNIGWVSVGVLIIWSILVVISFGIAGNRIYQLSDVFRVSDDAHILLGRVVTKYLKQEIYVADANYQNHFKKIASDKIELLKNIQQYGCKLDLVDNSSMLNFMCVNLELIEHYWLIKVYLPKDSFWFRRKGVYQRWHKANDTETSIALRTGTALRPKEEPDHYWFEDELMSINHACVNYLIKKNDFSTLYSYFAVFESICKSAIKQKEANYYMGEIDWLKNIIQNSANSIKAYENIAFAGIVEHISLLYLDIILESSKYFQNLDIDEISKSVIEGIDTGNSYNSIREIRGREYIEIYKKILTEVYAEGHRITPDWLIKQYVAKEEYVYVNSLFDLVKESIEHSYSLSSLFFEKRMYYEACIMLTRFYEYESKLSNFYQYADRVEKNLKKYHLDSKDKWDGSRLARVDKKFIDCKKGLPAMLMQCSSAFAIKNWDRREEYPDFLGESYNHIAEDTVVAIVNSDKEQFEKNFKNLTKIMLLYQEYIRSDFIKNKDLYRVEYAYYMFTSPIVEWAQIGGLGILWGEFFKDPEWSNIVKEASEIILSSKENGERSTDVAAQLIEYVSQRDKFMFGIGARDILKTSWNQFVENAIRKSAKIENKYVKYREEIKTDSKLIKAFCPNFLDMGFSSDPSEVFWVICVNPLLSEKKRFHTRVSWEKNFNE